MLIFEKFENVEKAETFAQAIRTEFFRKAIVCNSQEESDKFDVFPYELKPVIVLVERIDYEEDMDGKAVDQIERETEIEKFVESYGGEFAGT